MKSVIFQDIFIWKAVSQKLKVGWGKSVHFLKGLFKTYSKICLVNGSVGVIEIPTCIVYDETGCWLK